MELNFYKYEGAGNDFILIDGRGQDLELPGSTISRLCDRHLGIGADGLMILADEAGYDFRMRYYNADGGEVDMCGNGGRCIVLFADHLGIGANEKYFIGRDGKHYAQIISKGDDAALVELEMINVDSFQYSGLSYPDYKAFKERHPRKLLIFISHAEGMHPAGRTARKVEYDADVKIMVSCFKAWCKSRFMEAPGEPYVIWEEGAAKALTEDKMNEDGMGE